MSLIFDTFSSMKRAQAFVAEVKERFGLAGQVFDNPDDAHNHDPFPWVQRPIIVHIDRSPELEVERAVEGMVGEFGGIFVGT